MKVLHLLASNKFSGAENVVCQIIDMFKDEIEMVYCSPNGEIQQSLQNKKIEFIPLNKLTRKEVARVIKSYNPDVIHAHDVKASIIASLFSKRFPVISHIHGNDERNMGRITPKSFLYNLVSKKFKKIFWVSNSSFDRYYFKKNVASQSEVLYNIIDIDKLKEKALMDNLSYEYDICCLGRLVEIKNPLRALNILKQVIALKPQTKCAFIGDGEMREACENFVKDNNLSNNIKFLGFQSNPYKILQDSRLLLMSSVNEGTPMAVLESFALGIPLVSTKVDGAVELINDEHMGSLYDTNEQAVKQIVNILDNDKDKYVDFLVNFSKNYNNKLKYITSLRNVYRSKNAK